MACCTNSSDAHVFCQEGSPKAGGTFKRSDGPDCVERPLAATGAPPCHPVHLAVPRTHVAVVNVEDVHFGSRLNFLYSGPVPATASCAELKGRPWGVAPPGALVMAGERAQHFSAQGSRSTPMGVTEGSQFSTPPRLGLGALWSPSNGIRAELGAGGGGRGACGAD